MRAQEKYFDGVTRRWAALAMLATSPIVVPFAYFGQFEKGEAVWLCIGTTVIAVRASWNSRRHAWFWGAVAFAGLFQIPLAVLAQWRFPDWPEWLFLPLIVGDFAFVYYCIKLAERIARLAHGSRSLT